MFTSVYYNANEKLTVKDENENYMKGCLSLYSIQFFSNCTVKTFYVVYFGTASSHLLQSEKIHPVAEKLIYKPFNLVFINCPSNCP